MVCGSQSLRIDWFSELPSFALQRGEARRVIFGRLRMSVEILAFPVGFVSIEHALGGMSAFM